MIGLLDCHTFWLHIPGFNFIFLVLISAHHHISLQNWSYLCSTGCKLLVYHIQLTQATDLSYLFNIFLLVMQAVLFLKFFSRSRPNKNQILLVIQKWSCETWRSRSSCGLFDKPKHAITNPLICMRRISFNRRRCVFSANSPDPGFT